MRQALQDIYRAQSRGYKHKYETGWQLLDVDMTGMPTHGHGQGVTKGFFSDERNRRGRQLGRVIATLYDEIVVERLYSGKVQLERSLQPLMVAAEQVLDLSKAQRQQTIVRVDGGGGRDADINWLLQRDYYYNVTFVTNHLAFSVRVYDETDRRHGSVSGLVEFAAELPAA
jgi:hypothetical protein